MRRRKLLAATLALALAPGCMHAPRRSAQMEVELAWLDSHGYSTEGVDLPKSIPLAVLLDVFPPGVGHYYVGDVGDGLKVTFLFWLVFPWILGPIDAYREAKFQNDCAFIDYARAAGWFLNAEPEDGVEPASPAPRLPAPSTGENANGTRPKQAVYCPSCGTRFPDEAEFCPRCGRKR